ncbi:MAG TPA: aminotransferase class I/II-fold pyridoxal phosphate-dependent enzyme [Ignavibacteriales bacterium]|nr:aminotransferase class I/II-fold pyridoxal phosphate-dependent enzyme [Ignavibacteriales bacterium]HOL81144.1 aminotransferase class I/II-fold pyridoxal phosphate-dependent enzyme [Ignavibacteriales bacterium]HOM65247.1 aminotransferase class I/II-fold pyridoxal phosphate-dependent enzyme [Ignavibacteriales bacterium]HPD66539.1 aminotransferase class I/II-fold pyridoxal phosphate-dependent enzyme [Ignavibacteriales bacterium]HPP33500.1 aminotransferase class I/II-fold pyridoxal phosphate-dep
MENEKKYSVQTHLIYGKHQTSKWDYSHHVVAPVSSSTTFRLESVDRGAMGFSTFGTEIQEKNPIYIYDRLGEPNKDMLEENLADVENGEICVTFASGMGAISAALGILTKTGDEIIAHKTLYGCTLSLLKNWYPRYNIGVKFLDLKNIENLIKNITEKTKVIYFETPCNPNMKLIDIEAIKKVVDDINSKRSSDNKIYIVIDNTFASPFCQRPLNFGADFVVHSLTKHIAGFGTDMGGAVITRKEFLTHLLLYRKDFGGVLNPKSAWAILTYGLPSLPLRMKQEIETAKKVVEYLSNHPKVEFVNYPGLESFDDYELAKKQMVDFDGNFAPGSLLYFVLKGKDYDEQRKKGRELMNYIAQNAYTMTLAVSLGHTRTLIEHPASMTHSCVPPEELLEHDLHPGGVRIAIGLEKADDILQDLEDCLKQI